MWEAICDRRPRFQCARRICSFRVLTTTLAVFFGTASLSSAGVYSFHWERPPGFDGGVGPIFADDGAGVLDSLSLTYDSDTQRLTFLAAFEEEPETGNLPFGLSLVLNNGPAPAGELDEYAVLRFLSWGEHDPVLSAYVYGGSGSGHRPWAHGRHERIVSSHKDSSWVNTAGAVDSPTGRVISFDIDVSDINGFEPKHGDPADWFGIGFDDSIGLWMNTYALHWPGDDESSHNGHHRGWRWGRPHIDKGFFDFADQPSNVNIPEPASLALVSIGLVALCRRGGRAV